MARKKPFKSAYENFPVSKFKGISLRFEDDVYECAWLILRLDDAKGKGTNATHRHTVFGLAREFASLAGIPEAHVMAEFERRKLPLRASVEFDDKAALAITPRSGSGHEPAAALSRHPPSGKVASSSVGSLAFR